MQTSDVIQLLGILISLITSTAAIFISVLSLRQNSQMIENSTRPYIGIYGSGVYVRSPNYYIVIRNFGASSTTFKSFTYDFDLSKCVSGKTAQEPFQNIENSTLLPGQSYHCVIDLKHALDQTKMINFHVVYTFGVKEYDEELSLNLLALVGNYVTHKDDNGKPLSIISETLQDMHINSL